MNPRSFPAVLALSAALLAASPAWAVLKVGVTAPDFSAQAALAGKPFRFSLSESLKQGPVVLYFYPKAFTSGCTVEAHLFAEATPRFKALGATVIGVSNDDIETLKKFSVSECRNAFAVAADADRKVIDAYDAALWFKRDMADRVTYVITPDGRVALVYSAMSPDEHVDRAYKAVQQWKAQQAPAKP
ncbi:MAG: peroxiredoxin [Aquabacterium sp.]|nr:MAG: peroxiredoxin [Aquabacterium sp.]